MVRSRQVALVAVVVLLTTAVSGCSWFRRDSAYQQPPESRPLEVPPDLDRPNTESALGGSQSVMRSSVGNAAAAAPAATPATGFSVAGQRDAVFGQVQQALAGISGVTVANSAQLLGTFDVSYEGSSFLIRLAQNGEQVNVSAVDPRGVPAAGAAPARLMAALKAALGG